MIDSIWSDMIDRIDDWFDASESRAAGLACLQFPVYMVLEFVSGGALDGHLEAVKRKKELAEKNNEPFQGAFVLISFIWFDWLILFEWSDWLTLSYMIWLLDLIDLIFFIDLSKF